MSNELQKPVIGFSCGDLNGIGTELIIKTLSDSRIMDMCVPVVFANNKSINFYKKALPDINLPYQAAKDLTRLNHKQLNIVNCWEEEVQITPGQLTDIGGKYALQSLQQSVAALKAGHIHGLVTAPIHKKNIQSSEFNYSGHTPYLKDEFKVDDVVMLMTAENMRVAVLTEHIPVKEIATYITKENILKKLSILNTSLQKDFGIDKPKIAVLGLNPHAGDEGLIGNEEETIIKPALKEARHRNILAFGPFSADAFFARGQYEQFDAVLAMYHDQGLIPFKSLAIGEGVNYTAGLPVVRTSPDHGTAFDIAGKGKADASSFLAAIFMAIDVIRNRATYAESHSNPLKKISARVLANAEDEKIEENEG
ncbi:4-hydroxythreonine-4-phosphate dehydrogenase [Filimonas lacunae]|uniref:4-hydroxythreonine-4-phosphate dehydrogenase n=1 Tax=Filimonas lacunae TaxID=477680 RepID=A0A173MP30_9BACT|nr:4-hydroxythreonine-4-phosphate dehydrogenase PdxA [Filimonas lacunae]BAV09151.1 4-hydroxythreonine-4-phosphate dehydrogenase [Filimonas lacunae]SIS68031.1 4-hydroxythreonine-4-phosphate dehydrogenase [Filimonas lacunae]